MFATVMGLLLFMCIMTSCSPVLCVFMVVGMFIDVTFSLMRPPPCLSGYI